MQNDVIIALLFAALALSVGSFLNVVIYRLPLRLLQPEAAITLALPRSFCPGCRTPLRIRDNIPLLSWLHLRGRCRHCQQPIGLRYPLIEALTLLLSSGLALMIPFSAQLLCALILLWTLLALAAIDIQHQLLPDALTLPLLWSGLLLHAGGLLPGELAAAVIGAAAGYLLFRGLAALWQRVRGIEALGRGDAKLLAALGAWLGWTALPNLLLLAASSGILIMLLLKLFRQRPLHQPVAFGPCLALSGMLMLLFTLS